MNSIVEQARAKFGVGGDCPKGSCLKSGNSSDRNGSEECCQEGIVHWKLSGLNCLGGLSRVKLSGRIVLQPTVKHKQTECTKHDVCVLLGSTTT